MGLVAGRNEWDCLIEEIHIVPGQYFLGVKISTTSGTLLAEANMGTFEVLETPGALRPLSGWYREKATWSRGC